MINYKERYLCDWSEDSIRLIATPSMIAKSTFFYVQEIGHFKTKSQYFTERENLKSYLFVYTLSGKGYLKYKGKSYTLLPNQAFFIHCMDYQYYETDKQNLWEILWLHFDGSSSHGYYEQFAKNGSPILTLEKDSCVLSILYQLLQIHQQKDIRNEILGSKLLVDLLTELLLVRNNLGSSTLVLPSYVEAIIHDLDERFHEKITLDLLAKKYSISKFYLVKEFKRYTGFTLNEYIINTRVTYAKELLKYSNISIAEVANKVGIENVSHFINLFKHREDMTPLAFRKMWQAPK